MAIDSTHKDYAGASDKWSKCRVATAGQDAVHKAGKQYLPPLKDQTPEDYDAYKSRATYFNACGRTLSGLVGMVFRKDPAIDVPDTMRGMVDDIDLNGTSLTGLAQHILTDDLMVGRMGILVEYPRVDNQPRSQAEEAARNLRPYTSVYCAESILNWKVQRVNNVLQAVLVVLQEEHHEPVDEFSYEVIPQIRLLKLDPVKGYFQQIWRKPKNANEYSQVDDDIIPLMNGKPLSYIPFFMFGPHDNDFTVQIPPLLDLVNLNLAHYRVTADYEHGCHFTGLPMLLLAGIEVKENEKIYLGSQTAVVTSNADAHGEFVEFQGQGLGALEKNLASKEAQMAAIGARMLAPEKNGVEAEGTLQMRSNGESSVLASYANLVSQQLTKVLQCIAEWAGYNVAVSIKLNTDYMPAGMTAQELAELTRALQSGSISYETYFENLQRGEIIRAGKTVDEEKQQIEDGITLPAGGE
jgi:hypothetical protein